MELLASCFQLENPLNYTETLITYNSPLKLNGENIKILILISTDTQDDIFLSDRVLFRLPPLDHAHVTY